MTLIKFRSMQLSKATLLVAMLFSTSILSAEDLKGFGSAYAIRITPRSCLVEEQTKTCNSAIFIDWQFNQSTNFCVSLESGFTLFCESQQIKGQRQLTSSLNETTTFIVSELDSGKQISSATVYVLKKTTSKLRKRFRHPWSVF